MLSISLTHFKTCRASRLLSLSLCLSLTLSLPLTLSRFLFSVYASTKLLDSYGFCFSIFTIALLSLSCIVIYYVCEFILLSHLLSLHLSSSPLSLSLSLSLAFSSTGALFVPLFLQLQQQNCCHIYCHYSSSGSCCSYHCCCCCLSPGKQFNLYDKP